jgi:hypothetical protein
MNFNVQPLYLVSNPYRNEYPLYNQNRIDYNPAIHKQWKHFNTIISEISYNNEVDNYDTTSNNENKGYFLKKVQKIFRKMKNFSIKL